MLAHRLTGNSLVVLPMLHFENKNDVETMFQAIPYLNKQTTWNIQYGKKDHPQKKMILLSGNLEKFHKKNPRISKMQDVPILYLAAIRGVFAAVSPSTLPLASKDSKHKSHCQRSAYPNAWAR